MNQSRSEVSIIRFSFHLAEKDNKNMHLNLVSLKRHISKREKYAKHE